MHHKVVQLRTVERSPTPARVTIAKLSRVEQGEVFVLLGGGQPVRVDTTVLLSSADVGRSVAVMTAEGNDSGLIITGLVRTPSELARHQREGVQVRLDGQTLCLSAQERIELRCGDSVIVLAKDGRVLIKGVELVSRASRLNRIKGGSVKIN